MNEKEKADMRSLLTQMPKSSLLDLKRMIGAELDNRPKEKDTIRPNTPWNHYVTRGHE